MDDEVILFKPGEGTKMTGQSAPSTPKSVIGSERPDSLFSSTNSPSSMDPIHRPDSVQSFQPFTSFSNNNTSYQQSNSLFSFNFNEVIRSILIVSDSFASKRELSLALLKILLPFPVAGKQNPFSFKVFSCYGSKHFSGRQQCQLLVTSDDIKPIVVLPSCKVTI